MNRREKLLLLLYIVSPFVVVLLIAAHYGLSFLASNLPIVIGVTAAWFLTRVLVILLYRHENSTKS